MKSIITNIQNCIWRDIYNRYFVIGSVILAIIEYFVWSNLIVAHGIFVYTRLSYYPIQLLLIIIIVHIILSVYSYEKDEHISHLLLGAIPFFTIFTLALEMFYIFGSH